MTLAQIITQALRQLDEDPEDVGEYEELFRAYANMGYDIAVRDYLKPRQRFCLHEDEHGIAFLPDARIVRVVELKSEGWRDVPFDLLPDGRALRVLNPRGEERELAALCEIVYPPLEEGNDEPRIPPFAHPALCDYVCYRHLSSGNLAKQSRAQFYHRSFLEQMNRIRPQGMGSVTRYKNLYEVTSLG